MKDKKDWLKLEIFGLLEYGIQRDQLRLFNENCTDTYCICQFVKEYEKTSSLSQYFSYGENGTSHYEIFGKLQLLESGIKLIMQKITDSDQNPALI